MDTKGPLWELSILRYLCLWWVFEPIPCECWGITVEESGDTSLGLNHWEWKRKAYYFIFLLKYKRMNLCPHVHLPISNRNRFLSYSYWKPLSNSWFYLSSSENFYKGNRRCIFVGKLSFLCDNLYLYIIVTSFKKDGTSAFAVVLWSI